MELLLPRLPRHVLLSFARFAGTLAYYADARGRDTARENLRVVFRGSLSQADVRRIILGSYQNFARTFADLFCTSRLTPERWHQLFTVENEAPESIEQAKAQGAVMVTPHLGNFEFAGMSWGFLGIPLTSVAQDFKNPGITPIFQRLRSVCGQTTLARQGAVVRIMKVLARRGHVGMLTDLNIQPGRVATAIDCFGLKTCVTTIHATLTHRLGLMILPCVCLPQADGGYLLKIFAPIRPTGEDGVQEATQQCWDIFENEIRKKPELWMWMYKHWRYLPTDEHDPAYPDYANVSKPFQKMLQPAA